MNYEVRKWLDEVVHVKRNQTTQKTPNERFKEEQGLLLHWNTKPLYSIQQWELREVSKDCLISYKGNQYSTPYRFACQRVKVRETNEAILEIYDEYECVARHPMVEGKHQITMDQAHYQGLVGMKKEQEMNLHGLATPDSPAPLTNVENRSLATYAALEEGN